MIRISAPRLVKEIGRVSMVCHIEDDKQHLAEEIYYATPALYGDYLSYEVADAFVVGCLLPAALYGEDIQVDGAISERLFYNLSNSVSYILSLIYGNRIRIQASQLVNPDYNATGVGCGCSLGVDSFAAMLQHFPTSIIGQDATVPASYRITHLTYFNIGAMGYVDLQKAKLSYEKDLQRVRSFAEEVGLPVVELESNFSLLYKDLDFDASGDVRNFSAVLALQKLFGRYLYGSTFPMVDFRFDKGQTGYYESVLAPLLSTESTEIIIANPDMSRIDKTRAIADNPLVQKYLYVCWKELIANRWPHSKIAAIKDAHVNCSRCDKCKRTLLALDLMGKLPSYQSVFDLDYWASTKDAYIAKVIYRKDESAFYKDLYNLMQEKNYRISPKAERELRILRRKNSLLFRGLRKIKNLVRTR